MINSLLFTLPLYAIDLSSSSSSTSLCSHHQWALWQVEGVRAEPASSKRKNNKHQQRVIGQLEKQDEGKRARLRED